MSFSITPAKYNRRMNSLLITLAPATRRGIREGFYGLGFGMKKLAKENILKGPKTGRIYRIRGRRHQASAPGESPANLTGNLQRSVGFDVRGSDTMEFGYRVHGRGAGSAAYGRRLELGGTSSTGVRIAKRPNLAKVVAGSQAAAARYFETAIRSEIKPQ